MKPIHLILVFVLLALSSAAQTYDVNKWVELLKDNSKSQYICHYKVYLDITKLDSASKIKAAKEIAAACAKGRMDCNSAFIVHHGIETMQTTVHPNM